MGCLKKVFSNPIVKPLTDVALAATGNAAFIPVANAAETYAGGGNLKQSALSGVEALGAQELGGAVGIGQGNTAFNNALGITWDNPAGTGLPDIGKGISDAADWAGNKLGFTSGGTAAPVAGSVTDTGQPVDASGNPLSSTPSTGSVTTPSSGSTVGASEQPVISEKALDAMLNPTGSGATSLGNVSGGGNTGTFNYDLSGNATGASASPTTVAAAAPSSGGGLSDFLPSKSEVGSAVLKNALPLGGLAYEALKGPSALPPASQTLAPGGAATAPLLALEQQNATEAQTGQLTPSQQASITKTVQEQQNQLIQQLASQGVTDPTHDSRYLEGMKTIQQNALALENQYIQQALTNAVSAGGAASTNIANVAQEQISNDAEFQNALASAFGAIGGFGGASAKAA